MRQGPVSFSFVCGAGEICGNCEAQRNDSVGAREGNFAEAAQKHRPGRLGLQRAWLLEGNAKKCRAREGMCRKAGGGHLTNLNIEWQAAAEEATAWVIGLYNEEDVVWAWAPFREPGRRLAAFRDIDRFAWHKLKR
jgi:hypothetical protein